jgi:hypothetical protein
MNMQNTTPVDALADLEEVCRQAKGGIVRDPELLKRVYEHSARIRKEMVRKFGVQNIGAEIIREMRDQE